MSSLTFSERTTLERVFGMGTGYVGAFSNRTFSEFVGEAVGVDIYDGRFGAKGTSKANHLREFWRIVDDATVATLMRRMAEYGSEQGHIAEADLQSVLAICRRLATTSAKTDTAALVPNASDASFAVVARAAREAIDAGKPEEALDRLHTFTTKYLRVLAEKRGISVEKDKPLHSIMGEYSKALSSAGELESEMSARIMKHTTSTLEAFNHVRNNQSLAHDNQTLKPHEAAYVVNHIISLVRLLQVIDGGTTPIPDAQ